MKALEFLKKKGLEVRCSEDNLILRPVKLITEDVKAYVKKHKQEILNELRQVEENTLWSNPHEQGTPEARRETLTQCIDATWGEAFAEVRKALEKAQRQYRGGPEMVELEKRKEDLQAEVLKGRAKLEDFRLAVENWRTAAMAGLN